MMNRILSEGLAQNLRDNNRAPLLARKLPPNDGGLSLGQAALARAVLRNDSTPSLRRERRSGEANLSAVILPIREAMPESLRCARK